MKVLTILATAIATVASQWVETPFRNCGIIGTTDQVVSNFTLVPGLCPGKNATMTSTGLIIQDIIDPAKLSISGKLFGRVAYTNNLDLCKLLAAAGTPCPIPAGTAALSFDALTRASLPPNVSYTVTFMYDKHSDSWWRLC